MAESRASWVEGSVDPTGEHIRLCFGDDWTPVALLAPAGPLEYMVEFLVKEDAAEALSEVRRELDYYLVELQDPDPWAYAIYHCGAASNLYSTVHWQHVGPTDEGDA